MSKAKSNRSFLLGSIALAVMLAGCGNRMPANVPDPEEPPAPAPSEPALPVAPVEPVAPPPVAPVVPGTPNYQGPTVGSLVVSGVEKSKSGLIFKKLTV
jgi:multidrug efflux pump subunit AcrA (membrane-fusion protein)